ncbi:hypothetical protein HYU07_07305 [Candidatus Woesearchaeota archaeon]|nr:hypothetical protein [Candidatus Woesearchaeota archaeon]
MEDTYLLEQKFQLLMDMGSKKLQQEIAALKTTVSMLQDEVRNLRNDRRNAALEQPRQASVAESASAVKAASNEEYVPKSNVKEAHPRLGNYSSEDVSIEKFFNYGRK